MSETKFEPRTAVYTPQESSTYAVAAIQQAREMRTRGIGIPLADMEDYFAPVMPGQVCGVIAQTSNYKSGFMHWVERKAAERLAAQGREDEIIIHVSVEECVEEQVFLQMAHASGESAGKLARGIVQDWTGLMQAAIKIGNVPIYRIGDSLARAEDMPNLYMSNMIRAIKTLRDDLFEFKPKIAGIFFDYLQAFPVDPEVKQTSKDAQRRLQVREDTFRLRQAASYFSCPVFVAIQAKQHLDGANPPIMLPGVYDGEESSSIAQRLDRVITLWMPKQTSPVGYTITFNDQYFKVAENQLWIKVAKQRGGLPSGKVWRCLVDFERNDIRVEPQFAAPVGRNNAQ